LAKYRKLKAVDPFNKKGNYVLKAKLAKYNRPLTEKDVLESRPPASFRAFMGDQKRAKRQEQLRQRKRQHRDKLKLLQVKREAKQEPFESHAKAVEEVEGPSNSATREDHQHATAHVTVQKKVQSLKDFDPEVETYNEFLRRLKRETREVLVDDAKKNSVRLRKKREFRKRQASAKKTKKQKVDTPESRIDELEEAFLDDRPGFGEVAQAPPELPSVSKNYKISELPNHATLNLAKAFQQTPKVMTAERQEFEARRQRVIDAYRLTKKLKLSN